MKQILNVILYILLFSCRQIDDLGVLVPPTVDQDPNLPSISVKIAGRQRLLHVKTFGNTTNPPLFVLHGSYTDIRPYTNVCKSLSDKYFVVIWDQRGCGLSERITEDEFTLQTAIDEINAMKDIYAPDKKITIIGQSWGGGLACLYTSSNPQRVDQLVLIEPMPLTGNDMQQVYKNIVEFNYFNSEWNEMARQGQALNIRTHEQLDYRAMLILRSTMTKNYHCNSENPPQWPIHRVGGFIEYVRNKRLGTVSGAGYLFQYNFVEGIKNYNDTVLLLGGSCSSLGYQFQLNYSVKHFKYVNTIEIQNAGHRMTIEKFDEVMAIIKNFLKNYQNEN